MKVTLDRAAWALALGLVLGSLIGCVSGLTVITSFVANPTTITAGASATLTGIFANGTGVITPGNLTVTSGTPVGVSPSATTAYTLTVTNLAGAAVTQTATITVNPASAAPVITSFVADPATITAGGSAALTGVFANGTGVITPGNLAVTSGTPVSVSPIATTTYTLTVTNSSGTAVTKAANVTVTPAVTTYVLTVKSTDPSGGVAIDVSPADANGATDGSTSFTRTYNAGTTVTLTAPADAGSDSFSSWSGCATTSTVTCTVTMNANTTVTAAYASAASSLILSPYKDVTVSANWNTGEQQSAVTGTTQAVTSAMPNQTLTWAFATGTCGTENWGGISPAEEATNVQLFVNAGKKYIVSTGGAGGSFDCPSGTAFLSFIQTYYSANMLGVDFDIEVGQSQAVIDDLVNAAIAGEQQYPDMRFSFTIATLGGTSDPDLGSVGTLVVNEIKRLGLGGNYTINLMVMDYGSTSSSNCDVVNNSCDMGQSAIAAAEALNSQFGIPYSHIELTPDIGQNDTQSEVFTLDDVDTMATWMVSNGLAGAHFWSLDRDNPCAEGTDTSTCNGNPSAGILAYTNAFMTDLDAQ